MSSVAVLFIFKCFGIVLMGDTLNHSGRSRNSVMTATVSSRKEFPKRSLVAAIPRAVQQTIYKHVSLVNNGGVGGSGIVGDAAVFLLKIAALEVVRRVSKAKCPYLWNSLQALQCLCYPPLKWIQRWAPFKELIKAMQVCCYCVPWHYALSYLFWCY